MFLMRFVLHYCTQINTRIRDESYKGSFIDVININNKKEWCHIRTNICFPIPFRCVFSGVMLLADDFIDNIHGETDRFYVPVSFSSCKDLYINHDNLIISKRNERNFIGFHKQKDLEREKVLVFGIFKSTIILIDELTFDDYIGENYCYFLSYNERLQLRVCKRIDLSIPGNPNIEINQDNSLEIIQEVGKMFLTTYVKSVFVIDLRIGQVTQILEYPSCFCLHYDTYFRWSKYDRMLNIKLHGEDQDRLTHHNRWFNLKFGLFNGMDLKVLALNTTIECFSFKEIHSFNLPHSLFREILNRKTY